MQKIIIAGRLGQDAQTKEIGERIAINFNVAVNEKRSDKEITRWYSCTIWRNKDKANLAPYLKSGVGVIIEGSPDVEAWLSKEKNEPAARIKITVTDLHFMNGKPNEPTA
jgi:single-strand DNA-binding protein